MTGKAKKAYVLGGYGFIGRACVRALIGAGFEVVGVGRSRKAARACDSTIDWLIADIASAETAFWRQALADADVVVNAAGALQDGPRDSVTAIHQTSVQRIIAALGAGQTRFIQISAAGARVEASTGFMASKARGDALLMQSSLDWVVLRPTLVLGAEAYGGSALLRASAALPGVGLLAYPDASLQTCHVGDLAQAVVQAARGEIAAGTLAELAEPEPHSFAELTQTIRIWLGYPAWRVTLPLPGWLMTAGGRLADALGWLGWRSPLRSTALRALRDGVTGDPSAWITAGGRPMRPLADTLAATPATAADRQAARLFLLLPMVIALLALFWIGTGGITLLNQPAARAVLTERGSTDGLAAILVIGGALLDIALGVGVLIRTWCRRACGAMIALSLAYLLAGSSLAPDLWADPLGPLLKILPVVGLALLPLSLLEPR